jgi:hypothetical protein
MKDPMTPVHDYVSPHEEDGRLQPQGQGRQRAVPILIERDQSISSADSKQQRRAHNQEPDAQVTRQQRNDEPIANIGHKLALAPPRAARIARPEKGQDGKHQAKQHGDRNEPEEGRAKAFNDRDEPVEHDTHPQTPEGSDFRRLQLRCREAGFYSPQGP